MIKCYANIRPAFATGQNILYLPIPSGRLKNVSMINTVTGYQRCIIDLLPANLMPATGQGTTNIDPRFTLAAGCLGSALQPWIEYFDLPIDGNEWCIQGTFLGCTTTTPDRLGLKVVIDV